MNDTCDVLAWAMPRFPCALALALVLSSTLIFGCTKETLDSGEEDSESDDGGDDDNGPCIGDSPYLCECDKGGQWIALEQWVYGSYATADNACHDQCKLIYENELHSWKVTPVECVDGARIIDCSSWNPSASIDSSDANQHRFVERALIESLTRDPEPLRSCDDAVLMRHVLGGHVVVDASPGELLYELGLRDGDTVQALNGYPLDTPTDVAVAYTELWSNGETEFVLDLRREGIRVKLLYTLVD